MKKRMLVIASVLGILTVTWVVSWKKYSDQKVIPKDEEGKTSQGNIHFKRLPATLIFAVPTPPPAFDVGDYAMAKRAEEAKKDFSVSETRIITGPQSKYAVVENLSVVDESERGLYFEEDIAAEKFKKLLVRRSPMPMDKGLVVQNSRTKVLGIVTGVFKIKLHDHDTWSELEDEFNLSLEGNFPGIRVSLLKSTDFINIESLLSQIEKDPRVERVELEILENETLPK